MNKETRLILENQQVLLNSIGTLVFRKEAQSCLKEQFDKTTDILKEGSKDFEFKHSLSVSKKSEVKE